MQSKMKLDIIFKGSAAIVAIFSAIFVWYSNSFFINRRKKEIATYNLLGMKKYQIGIMLFYENIILGVCSLILGIFIGLLFSRVFSAILLNLMLDTTKLEVELVWKAAFITVIVFFVMFLTNSLYTYTLTYRFKLIELFNASKKGEKEPKTSFVGASLSVVLILLGYVIVITNANMNDRIKMVIYGLLVIVFVVVGTYLLFSNFIVIILKRLRMNKGFYYKGVNIIGTSQILYRIKGNAVTLATIAILSSMTLISLSAAFIYHEVTNNAILGYAPFSYVHIGDDKSLNDNVVKTIQSNPDFKLLSIDNINFISATTKTPYYSPFGKSIEIVESHIMSQSQYNQALTHQNRGPLLDLKDDGECLFIELNVGSGQRDELIGQNTEITTPGLNKTLKILDTTTEGIVNVKILKTTIVTTDNVYNDFIANRKNNVLNIRGYVVSNATKSRVLTEELRNIIPNDKEFDAYYDMRVSLFKISGVYIFTGVFLGVLFLLATGSIIYFKQLLEANGDKDRYTILMKIGVSKKEIKQSVAKQHIAIFGLPLLVGICHSGVAFYVLQYISQYNLFKYYALIILAYFSMYVVYYVATVNSYTKIVTYSVRTSTFIHINSKQGGKVYVK
jgi:putative ABC transport system permease protein